MSPSNAPQYRTEAGGVIRTIPRHTLKHRCVPTVPTVSPLFGPHTKHAAPIHPGTANNNIKTNRFMPKV